MFHTPGSSRKNVTMSVLTSMTTSCRCMDLSRTHAPFSYSSAHQETIRQQPEPEPSSHFFYFFSSPRSVTSATRRGPRGAHAASSVFRRCLGVDPRSLTPSKTQCGTGNRDRLVSIAVFLVFWFLEFMAVQKALDKQKA